MQTRAGLLGEQSFPFSARSVCGAFEVAFHHFCEAAHKRREFRHSKGCRPLDGLNRPQEIGDTIKRFINGILNSDKAAGVETDSILQLTLNFVGRGQDAALFFTERIPGGTGFRETLHGMFVADVFEFASQPLEILREVKKPWFFHKFSF